MPDKTRLKDVCVCCYFSAIEGYGRASDAAGIGTDGESSGHSGVWYRDDELAAQGGTADIDLSSFDLIVSDFGRECAVLYHQNGAEELDPEGDAFPCDQCCDVQSAHYSCVSGSDSGTVILGEWIESGSDRL